MISHTEDCGCRVDLVVQQLPMFTPCAKHHKKPAALGRIRTILRRVRAEQSARCFRAASLLLIVLSLFLSGCKKPEPGPTPDPGPPQTELEQILKLLADVSKLIGEKPQPQPSGEVAQLRKEIAEQSRAIAELKDLAEHFKNKSSSSSGGKPPPSRATAPVKEAPPPPAEKPLVVLFSSHGCSACIKAKSAFRAAKDLPFAWEERSWETERPAGVTGPAPILWWSETEPRPSSKLATKFQNGFSTLDAFLANWRRHRKVLFVTPDTSPFVVEDGDKIVFQEVPK